MKVTVSRSGGVAGLQVSWEVQVDDQPDPSRWAHFLNELPWDQVEGTEPQPDRYVYRIRVEPHEVVLSEPQVSGPWRELVDRVRTANDRA
jgi:hypothetical protein